MVGANFLGRAVSYVVNEVLVEGLANNLSFQRFAVRTAKAIKEVSSKVEQSKKQIVDQMRVSGPFKDS